MSTQKNPDYDVGFGKPPMHTRFTKGISGNPKGRPKGALSLTTIVNRTLKEPVVIIGKDGRRRTVSMLEAAFKRLVLKAVNGDTKAMQQVLALAHLLGLEESNSKTPLDANDAAVMAQLLKRFASEPDELDPGKKT